MTTILRTLPPLDEFDHGVAGQVPVTRNGVSFADDKAALIQASATAVGVLLATGYAPGYSPGSGGGSQAAIVPARVSGMPNDGQSIVYQAVSGLFVPGSQGGGTELSAATITTTGTASLTTAFTDIAGFSVAPVIGSRGIYIDALGSFGATAVATLIIQLYDVTAAAVVCQQTLVTVAGAVGLPFEMRARLAPAAGARAYKLRWAVGSGTTTGAFYGSDQVQSSGLYVIER